MNKLKDNNGKLENVGKRIEEIGKGVQGCGCIIMLIPILAILLWFIWTMLFDNFLE